MTTILVKRGTTEKIAAYTGTCGELVFDTDAKNLYVMDGETVGGIQVGSNDSSGDIDGGELEEPVSTSPTLTIIVEGKTVEGTVDDTYNIFQINLKDGTSIAKFEVGTTTFSYDDLNMDNPIQYSNNEEYKGLEMEETGGQYYEGYINSLVNIVKSKSRTIDVTQSTLYIDDETQSSSLTITMN